MTLDDVMSFLRSYEIPVNAFITVKVVGGFFHAMANIWKICSLQLRFRNLLLYIYHWLSVSIQ